MTRSRNRQAGPAQPPRPSIRPVALAIAALALGTPLALPAQAEPAPAAGRDTMEETVVTASRGRERSVTDTPVPVDVISAAQLESAGALGGEFGQALQNLVPSFNLQRQSNSGAADLVRPAQLRGMSPDQVLVLVNGKRRHTTSVTTTESKTGRGTAPVDFNSIPSNAIRRIEVLRDGAGSQYGSDAIAGVINVILDDRPEGFDASFTYGGQHTEFDPTGQDITDGETKAYAASYGLPLGDGGFLRVGGEFKRRAQTERGGFGDVPFFEDERNGDLVGGGRNFKPGDGKTRDTNLWLNAGLPLGDDLTAYGFATYSQRDGEGTGFYRYPYSSANILSVYPLGYRPVTTGDNTDFGFTTGVKGEALGWNWDGSVSWGRNHFEAGVKHSLNPSLGPTSPTEFRSATTENTLSSLNLDVSRPLELGLFAPATLALGAEYRHEQFRSEAGDALSYAAGPFAGEPDFLAIGAQAGGGLRPEEERDIDRDVASAYAELVLDLSEAVNVDLSTRYEDSDDYGSEWSGKVAARWEFLDGWALRGSLGNSFRAPSLVQLGYGTSSTSFGDGGRLTTVNTLPVDDAVARALGARDLEAETSTNYSIGVTGQLLDGLVLTVDAFRIDVDDRITLSGRIGCASELCADRDITAANFFTNAIDTRTDGVDVVLTYATDVMSGQLDLSAAYSYAKTEIEDVATPSDPDLVLINLEERNTIEDAAPRDKLVLTANWSNDTFGLLTRVTRWGRATRVFDFGDGFTPTQEYGREWQLDMEGSYQVTKGVEAFLGASNLTDAYPDKSIYDISYFGNFPYDVLSPVGMNGRFVYGGLRVKM